MGQHDPPNLHAGRTVQFLSNPSKIITSQLQLQYQSTADIIDASYILQLSLVFCKKIEKNISNRRSKNSYLLRDLMNFDEISMI